MNLDLDTDRVPNEEMVQLKQACPEVAVRLTCSVAYLVPLIQILGDSLVELHSSGEEFLDIDGLIRCDELLRNLRSSSLLFVGASAQEFLEPFLERRVGGAHPPNCALFIFRLRNGGGGGPCSFLAPIARHTGQLLHLTIHVLPQVSLYPIAVAHQSIRSLTIGLCSRRSRQLILHPDEVEKWIVKNLNDFIRNCSQLDRCVFVMFSLFLGHAAGQLAQNSVVNCDFPGDDRALSRNRTW